MPKILAIIPSRFGSTRFPGKPLITIEGKTLIQRVYEQVIKTPSIHKTIVATDDVRIQEHVLSFGGEVVLTSSLHPTGTDRCIEAAEIINLTESFDVVLNIQGDEPFVDPIQINDLARLFEQNDTEIGTMVKKITDSNEIHDKKEVKVVFNKNMEALYMSRNAIPYVYDYPLNEWHKQYDFYKHIGIYGFRMDVLLAIKKMKQTNLEKIESLEQLRWMDEFKIKLAITTIDTLSIDYPSDLDEVYKYL